MVSPPASARSRSRASSLGSIVIGIVRSPCPPRAPTTESTRSIGTCQPTCWKKSSASIDAEPAGMASNGRMKFLLAALLAPSLCVGAIWPENIGAWKRAATMQATLFDRPIWDEYGLKESESARYEKGDEKFTVTGYRLQDTTGSMAAFDWQRPAKSIASQLAPLAAETADGGDGLLVVHGNYLLSFTRHRPDAAELSALFDGLRNVDTSVLPSLPGNLPTQDRVAN